MALNKTQKIEQLKKLNVTLTGEETIKDLDELLKTFAPSSETSVDELEVAEGVQNQTQVRNKDVKRVVVRYINPDFGLTDREFTEELHGENFQEIAKQFAEKYKGEIEKTA